MDALPVAPPQLSEDVAEANERVRSSVTVVVVVSEAVSVVSEV